MTKTPTAHQNAHQPVHQPARPAGPGRFALMAITGSGISPRLLAALIARRGPDSTPPR